MHDPKGAFQLPFDDSARSPELPSSSSLQPQSIVRQSIRLWLSYLAHPDGQLSQGDTSCLLDGPALLGGLFAQRYFENQRYVFVSFLATKGRLSATSISFLSNSRKTDLVVLAGMDLTPVEVTEEGETPEAQGQDPQALAEAALKRRVVALIDKVTFVVFSYVAQVTAAPTPTIWIVGISYPCLLLSARCLVEEAFLCLDVEYRASRSPPPLPPLPGDKYCSALMNFEESPGQKKWL